MDLTMVPWGNSYYNTSACGGAGKGFDGAACLCWHKKCDPNATNIPSDCFTATAIPQHRHEAEADRREGCAIHYYPDHKQWLPWVVCYEGKGHLNKLNAKKCSKKANFDNDKIEACTTGALGQQLEVLNAKRTLAYTGGWTGTPTMTIGNKNFFGPPPEGLVTAICAAYTGTKPAACSK